MGGGCLGAAAALALCEQGHHVVLRERARLGSGSTGRAAGIVSTMTWHDEEYKLISETRGRLGELISLAMVEGDPSARHVWKPTESLVVARGPGLAALDAMQARLERHTEEPERLDHRQAAREFPMLRFEAGEEALVAQEDGVVEAGDLVQVLRGRLGHEGAEVLEERGLPRLAVRDGRVAVGPAADTTDMADADAVVVAGGAWTKPLLEQAGVRLPLAAYRTQLSSLRMPAEDAPILHDAVHHVYARPESDQSILVGDGTQLRPFDPDDFDTGADPEFQETVAAATVARWERGEEAAWRTGWAGLCVGTPDRRPLCGAVPGVAGLFVLTGDNGFGVMRCLALGERLADAVRGRPDAGLDPGRFGPDAPRDFVLREGYGL